MEQNQTDSYIYYDYRYRKYFMVRFFMVMFSIFSIFFAIVGILLNVIFFIFVGILFFIVMFMNLKIYKNRARFYLKEFSANQDFLEITYYNKDIRLNIKEKWENIDFYFGRIRGDRFLVIWINGEKIMKIYKTFANHNSKISEIQNIFLQYFPKQRIIRSNNFLQGELFKSRPYSPDSLFDI